jgi:hypothetical protein
MSYDPRTIALLTEVIFPPLELRTQAVQAIHNELYASPQHAYQNFTVGGDGILLSNPPSRPGAVSSVNFLPDRLQIREELTQGALDEYKARLEAVLTAAQPRLQFKLAAATQCVVRSLITPRHFSDTRELLARGLARFEGDTLASFGRPVGSLGFRFLFPQTLDRNNYFAIRIESFNQDPRSLFLENIGTFVQTPMPEGIPVLCDLMQQTYDFIARPTCEFIARFDAPDKQR